MERMEFTKPLHVTTWMAVFVAVIVALAAYLIPHLQFAFLANLPFNALILVVFAIGVVVNFVHVWKLQREVLWAESYSLGGPDAPHATKPVMLAPLARTLTTSAEDGEQPRLTPAMMRATLDGVQIRLEEQRDLSRYIIGALIFLGLLGTFWGLLVTVRSVGEIIGDISGGSNAIEMFESMKLQLDEPLSGMATSFSCALFGLAGSLVVGFLDLNAGHAQNRFYQEIDQWLASVVDEPAVQASSNTDEIRGELRELIRAINNASGNGKAD
ncbi:MAG: MotA/TolQ/ExbB proton channel family protein [Azoarcus sp.]|nr:MotA/TolQ/ExbB proton channel family protein [Azoarcus sp.]